VIGDWDEEEEEAVLRRCSEAAAQGNGRC
jgi:hypothetical protein